MPELIRIVINTAMQAEREQYLDAAVYERADTRRGHANGYKPKTVTTRVGAVTFDIPQVREGGFYPEALERGLRTERADEPRIDLRQPPATGAQAGFRVYQDWLDVINAHPDSRGLPVYITSTNTFQRDNTAEPAQNYPPGWLTAALDVVNREPQIAALCWYLDAFPHDDQWDFFSLTNPRGLMVNAADEFDSLLRLPSTVR